MLNLHFHIAGIPKAQPRVKAFRRGRFAGVYDPGTADNWKLMIRAEAKRSWSGVVSHDPIRMRVWFFMPRPKSHFAKDGSRKAKTPHFHTSKPDLDNLVKAVMDAINDCGNIWHDDSQVVDLEISKRYCEKQAGVTVQIDSL